MHRSVRDILARIDNVFAAGGTDSNGDYRDYWDVKARTARQLWDVLSALRGPDNENNEVKHATTAIIRAACFPKTYSGGDICIPATMCHDSERDRDARTASNKIGYHFRRHAQTAFDALGLSWHEVNTPSEIASAAAQLPKLGKSAKRKSKSGMTRRVSKTEQRRRQKKSARS